MKQGLFKRLLACCAGALLAGVVVHADAATAVHSLRLWRAPDHTRLVFDLSGAVTHAITPAANPERLIIDLDNSRLTTSFGQIDLSATPVRDIRSGMRDDHTLRIVLDLASTVDAKSFQLSPSGEYGQRLVVDLYTPVTATPAPTAPATTAPAVTMTAVAAGAAPDTSTAPSAVETSKDSNSTQPAPPPGRAILIAIDAGHGGDDPGAIGPKRIKEKNVVLAMARELERQVNGRPGYKALMIRRGDYYVGLKQRRDLARQAKADMFVSIHADAFTHSLARGGSVYALSARGATSASAAFLAQRENGADLIGGVNLGEKDDVLASVLMDLSMTAALDASLRVGNQVLKSMGTVTQLHRSRVEQAGFAVLKSPDMPSILVETGYISNPSEAERLNGEAYQRRMAEAIFNGVNGYFLSSPPPDTQLALAPRGNVNSDYVIARGDTLSGIADRYRVSVSSIIETNRLDAKSIQAGQRILIPSI